MKKYITNLYGHGQESTAMNAQHMITNLAKSLGYSEIGIRGHNVSADTEREREVRIEGILASVSQDSLIIAQVPTWCGIAFDEILLLQLRQRAEKFVVFVHDFVPLMFVNNRYLMKRYLEAYNLADLVILPSIKMAHLLQAEGLSTPYIIQEIWDHVTLLEDLGRPSFEKKLNFAGNITRFPFVKDWKGPLLLDVFSNSSIEEGQTLHFKGWMPDDALLRALNQGGFGLVWSENIDNQDEREYSEMNVSFKFSTYLAAGLPLIVNRGLAKQDFVEKYGVGFVVSSLDEAVDLVKGMSFEEYAALQERVQRISQLVREGFFTKKMLVEAQSFLYLGERNDNL
ncbi:sugar transferase [Lactococcus petauri]|uniref:sugar transferase n=1 Tax=Lactococcus petauri TaxID=1940789 RepID=UPI003854BBCD